MGEILDQSGLTGDWQDKRAPVLEIGDQKTFNKLDQTLGVGQYSVSNPHPGFGKDPNIINELGHTKYPMWITSKLTGAKVLVNNSQEEAQHTQEPEKPQEPAKPASNPWTA